MKDSSDQRDFLLGALRETVEAVMERNKEEMFRRAEAVTVKFLEEWIKEDKAKVASA